MSLESIQVTDAARTYLGQLLEKQQPGVGVRLFITYPGTPHAETCLAYRKPGESVAEHIRLSGMPFDFFVEECSIPFLQEAFIDYQKDRLGGELTIRAPHAKVMQIDENSSLEDRINYVLHNEINPALAAHGGMVSLIDVIEEDRIAVLQFGGGCQGCGLVDVTLKQGVETTLKEKIPTLQGVRDITDHSDRSNAYL